MIGRRQFLIGIAASAAAVTLVRPETGDGVALKSMAHPPFPKESPERWVGHRSPRISYDLKAMTVQRWVSREELEGDRWRYFDYRQLTHSCVDDHILIEYDIRTFERDGYTEYV